MQSWRSMWDGARSEKRACMVVSPCFALFLSDWRRFLRFWIESIALFCQRRSILPMRAESRAEVSTNNSLHFNSYYTSRNSIVSVRYSGWSNPKYTNAKLIDHGKVFKKQRWSYCVLGRSSCPWKGFGSKAEELWTVRLWQVDQGWQIVYNIRRQWRHGMALSELCFGKRFTEGILPEESLCDILTPWNRGAGHSTVKINIWFCCVYVPFLKSLYRIEKVVLEQAREIDRLQLIKCFAKNRSEPCKCVEVCVCSTLSAMRGMKQTRNIIHKYHVVNNSTS